MENKIKHSRRAVIKSSLLVIVAVSIPNIVFAENILGINSDKLFHRYPSVEITFQFKDDKVISLTVHEPDLTLKAIKI
jgi:hypothetical protein